MPTALAPPPDVAVDAATLLGVAVRSLTDAGATAHLAELHRLRAVVDAAVVDVTGVVSRRGAYALDGARSTSAWVAAHAPVSRGAAKGDEALARELETMPATAAAFAVGRIGREQVRLLARARADGLEHAFAACEDVLVDEVAGSTVAVGARFLRRWQAEVRARFGVDTSDGPPPTEGDDRSSVHLSCSFAGRWVLDGTLDAESGEVVAGAVDAQVDAFFTDGVFHADDGLRPSERRAIALVELVTRGTRGGEDDGTARPLVLGIVHLDRSSVPAPATAAVPPDPDEWLRTLSALPVGIGGRPPSDVVGVAELERAGVVDPSTAARWICEGDLQVVHVDPDDEDALRLGRRVRLATRAQRRALRARDGGCVFPGCSVDPGHCVAHHVRWWEWGGPTDIENLVLICRFHHRAVHRRGFAMTRTNGHVAVTRPDGQTVTTSLRCRPAHAHRLRFRPRSASP